jgi:glycosyltransferase involved in cell wall biosynthesis
MRLLLVTAWPLDTPGGTQTLVRSLATALAASPGVGVSVITGAMPDEPTIRPRAPLPASTRLPFRAEPRPAWLPPPTELVGRACLQGLGEAAAAARPDVLICVSHHSAEAHQAARVAADLGIPLVLWPLIHADAPRHVNQTAVRLYRRAATVVCSSGVERRWLTESAGLPAARTLLLECGSWAAETVPSARHPARPGGSVELLTVGAFLPHKRLADQVDAVASLASRGLEVRLTVAGAAGSRRVLDQLGALVRERGLDHRVAMLPDAAEGTLDALYRAADYFLFTSASESFGLALLDAICAGAFPVVYPHPTYAGLVDESGFGRVTACSTAEALADAIRRALAEPEPRDGPSPAWRAAHSWPRVAASLLARLRGLLP